MRRFQFILGRRALIVFLALLVATGALLGAPAATLTLAESPPPGSQEVSPALADSVAAEGPILDLSGHSAFLQGESGTSTWTLVPTTTKSPSAPSARWGHAMAATSSGVLLFGGYDGSDRNDTWLFNTATNTWGLLDTGSSSPSARFYHAMATTPSGVLLFGGRDGSYRPDTWRFNTGTGTWTLVPTTTESPSSPSARINHAMAALPGGDVLLFGGSDVGNRNDTWIFNATNNTWGQLTDTTSTPSARCIHAMAATPSGVLLFGGFDGSGSSLGDTWIFTYDNASKTGAWTLVPTTTASPSSPSARDYHAMASTPSGVLLFGGKDARYRDTWIFNATNNTWSQMTDSSAPPARVWHAMASTPAGAVLFGGYKSNFNLLNDTWLTPPPTPTISVTSPTGAHWPIGSLREITWTATDLNTNTLTILLARNGVDFTETLTHGLAYNVLQHTWTVTGPGTINAKIRVQQEATEGTSPDYFTITSTLFPHSGGTSTLTTSDPWLEISGGDTKTGTLWVTPLTPSLTIDPDLSQFLQETGKRAALFFDVGQEGLTGTLTIVLHFNHRLGEETFHLYLWDGAGWINKPGIPLSPNIADHTFTITINATDLDGTPFALGGNPAAMPGMSPWALALLSLSLLGAGGWWFSRRRRLA